MPAPSSRLDAWMDLALELAERGRGRVEPNPMVGAVIVKDGSVVGRGAHLRYGGAHAEVGALAEAGEAARGATALVTLEPCSHHGKTPPCADALIRAGVAEVVAAVRDPFPLVDGGGIARLRGAGIAVRIGVRETEARRLLAPFLKRVHVGRPYVIAKWAMTLDGRIATATGSSKWISGPDSRASAHEVRGVVDGIVAGIGTVLADDPMLNARPEGPRRATRIVLDSAGRLPSESNLARSAREIPVLVAVTRNAPTEARDRLERLGCEVLPFDVDGPVPIVPLLDELGRRGLTNVLVEGGGRVLGAFLDAREIDEFDVYVAPKIVGGPPGFTPVQGLGIGSMSDALTAADVSVSGPNGSGDLRIRGRLPRPWLAPRGED